MKIHWTESALQDLEGIENYISRHSPRYARSMIERIFARAEQITTHPRSGSIVPEYADESLRELLEKPYRIVYRILENRIDIITVVHAARQMPEGF